MRMTSRHLVRLWNVISNSNDAIGLLRFASLGKIIKPVLTISGSSAKEERVFSIIWKKKSYFRPNLDLDENLVSLLTFKLPIENNYFTKVNVLEEVIVTAKQATRQHNLNHRKQFFTTQAIYQKVNDIFCQKA